MVDADLGEFSVLLDATCSMLSRGQYTPNETATGMFFNALARYPMAEVRAAMNAHISDPQRGRFVPTPADILAQLDLMASNDGRPGVEEAWAIAVSGKDERVTIVWTDEIAQAMASAKPIMDLGDEVGARMAFKEAYARLVADARQQRRPMRWVAALGHDEAGRASALREAAAKGRVVAGLDDLLALPAPRGALLLEGPELVGMPDHIRARLQAVRDQMTRLLDEPGIDAVEKARTADLKAEAKRRVAAYLEGAA
jgi:hypothetical protein